MKKILLIGEDVSNIKALKLQLSTYFRVQNVNFLDCDKIKLFRPDFIIVYAEAASKENLIKLKKRLLNDNYFTILMFCIALEKEGEVFKEVFSDKDVTIIERSSFDAKALIEMLKKICDSENALAEMDPIKAADEAVSREVIADNKDDDDDEALKKRILVVDDDPVVLETIKMLMEDEFNIGLVSSGKDALLYLANNKVDIVLLDYMMPEFDGRQTLEMIRNNPKTAKMPVFFLSGISDKEKITQTLRLNPQGYILKPASKLDIYEKLSKYM